MKRCDHKSLGKWKLKWYYYPPMRMAKIQITDHAKCWWGYRATGTLIYCRWECKVVQPLWKTFWWFLPKLNTLLPYDTAVAFLGIYPKELKNYIHIKTCTQMFTAASFIMTAHTWKQPRWTDTYTVLHPGNGILFSAIHALEKENGNPLQCSCLENPRDGEAWWAAVYGVAQSRTRLKWLSSSIQC